MLRKNAYEKFFDVVIGTNVIHSLVSQLNLVVFIDINQLLEDGWHIVLCLFLRVVSISVNEVLCRTNSSVCAITFIGKMKFCVGQIHQFVP